MFEICAAAARAARRTKLWLTYDGKLLHELNGHRSRRVRTFDVVYRGKSHPLLLTSGGIVMHRLGSGYYPLALADCDYDARKALLDALDELH